MAAESRNLILGAVLLLALALRLGWGWRQPPRLDERLPDQVEYFELAQNLLHGQGLRFYDGRLLDEVFAYRMPGYPLFLAACGGNIRTVRAAQAVLDTSTVLAAYLLARRWMGHVPGLFAASFVAFNPFLVYFSALILSETLFVAMLAWASVLLVWRRNYLWGGMILALSVLARPSAIALPVLLGYGAVFVMRQPGEMTRRRWLRAPVGLTMLFLTILALAPWAIRNYSIFGQWVWLTSNGGITRYDGFNPAATGASDQRFVVEPEMRPLFSLTELQRDAYLAGRADEYIARTWREDPSRLLKLTASKIGRTWSPLPLSSDFGSRRAYIVAALAYSIPLDLLAVVGLFTRILPRSAKAFLLMPAVYFTVVHAMSVGSLRYRMPAEPMLAVLAGAGAAGLLATVLRSPSGKRFLTPFSGRRCTAALPEKGS